MDLVGHVVWINIQRSWDGKIYSLVMLPVHGKQERAFVITELGVSVRDMM